MRAAIYSRFSTDRQDLHTIADQLRVCSEWAKREGAMVALTFADEGISGAAIGNRPGFIAAMRAAQNREFDVLVAMDLSRLSRSQGDLAKTVDRLKFVGIRVVGVQDGFDTTRDGHELVSGLSGIIGQEFRRMVARKTHSALQSRALNKRAAGGKPYGYRSTANADGTKGLEVVPAEAAIVRAIFDDYGARSSLKAIASDLNRRGVPSPGANWKRTTRRVDGKWLMSGVRAILTNEVYLGRMVWNRSQWVKDPDSGKRMRRERPQSEWVTHEAPELRIVSDAAWKLVQDRMAVRASVYPISAARTARGGRPKFLLSGLLVCAECGSRFTISGINRSQRYICSSHTNGGSHACSNGIHVARQLVEDKILGPTIRELLSPEAVALASETIQRLYRERQAQPARTPRKQNAQVARLDRQIEDLERLVRDGVLTAEVAAAAIERARAERSGLMATAYGQAVKRLDQVVRMPDGHGGR
jgi:site-specific DNA recombinase